MRFIKAEELIAVEIGGNKGLRIAFQFRDYAGNRCLRLTGFVWGTYLGRNPNLDRRCCSNGITLFSFGWIKS